ncbi:O-acetyltransferase OatA [Halioglobus japonicus]|nr:O-acetyltransferase OatA [Halioglobus japonicus]
MFRGDVEGLRALAVIAVLLFHFDFEVIQGGFLGVDIFFVISGYVISKGMMSRLSAGTFTLSDFYTRRFRRILPALLATLIVVLIAGFLLSPLLHFRDLGLSAIYSALSVSNFYFPETTGYFGHKAIEMPLLHMWSLSVEEQFYFIWPLVLVVLFRKVRAEKLHTVITVLIVLFLLISQAWVFTDPKYAFFMAPARFFEFLLGAWVVTAEKRYSQIRPLANDVIFAVGLAICIAALLGMDESMKIPGVYALIPAVAVAMIIFAGARSKMSAVFSNPVARFFGKISYSLYLVHWPLVVFYRNTYEYNLTLNDKLTLLAVSIVLATLMWRYIEQPFRTSGRRDNALSSAPQSAQPASNKRFYTGLVATMSSVIGLSWFVYTNEGLTWRMSATSQDIYRNYTAKQENNLRCKDKDKLPGGFNCFGEQDEVLAEAILIGDSHVNNFRYGLAELFQSTGTKSVFKVINGCPPLPDATIIHSLAPIWQYVCASQNKASFKFAKEDRFSVALLAGRWTLYTQVEQMGVIDSNPPIHLGFGPLDERSFEHSMAVFEKTMEAAVSELVKAQKKVIVFGQVPELGFDIERCLFTPDYLDLDYIGCAAHDANTVRQYTEASSNVLRKIASKYPDSVLFLDSSDAFCDEQCIFLEDNTPLYRDENHLTYSGSLRVIEYHRDAITEFLKDHGPAKTSVQ